MRNVATLVVVTLFAILLGTATAEAQVSIGINIPVFPQLVIVPGYPVYYAPRVHANYFFYDGLYWVFNVEDGYWYSSSWYNGPWVFVEPAYVPQFLLVVPYRYYRVRPRYWSGWERDRPPRWGQHWGRGWESSRHGWDQWDRSRRYEAAPLPLYQKRYERDRYPAPSQQVILHNEQYHYQPHDVHVREEQTTILDQQSRGGARARGKAERVVAPPEGQAKGKRQERTQPPPRPENAQRPQNAQPQERGQPPGREKGQSQERTQPPPRPEKAQRPEQVQPQERGQPPQGPGKGQRQEETQPPQGQENTQNKEKRGHPSQGQEKGQEGAPPVERQ